MTAPDHHPADLATLVARAARGDREAFAALVRHHQRPLFSFLGRMGLGQGEAEELAQDAFLRAWQHLPRYQPSQAAFSTWLYTIARRLALNELDRADRRLREHPADGPPDRPSPAPGPAEQLQQHQQQRALQAALRQLGAADRSVLALAYVGELSLADVARIEGSTEAAIKARLHRARQQLRALLTDTPPLPRSDP